MCSILLLHILWSGLQVTQIGFCLTGSISLWFCWRRLPECVIVTWWFGSGGTRACLTNHCPSVLWHCSLGHISLTRKIVSEMTYIVSSGTLNPTIPIPVWLSLRTLLVDNVVHSATHSWQSPCSFSRRAPIELHDNKDTKRSSWSSPFFEISTFCNKCNDHDNLVYLTYPQVQKVREICLALQLRMYVHVCFSTFVEYLTRL